MNELRRQVTEALSNIPIDFGGGCSLSKAYVMAWLIRRFHFTATVDIGVYRGRSLVPQVIAHRLCTRGVAYGVDPWLNEEVREIDNPALRQAIDKFVDTTDFPTIYQEVETLLQSLGLEKNCMLIRKRSSDAIRHFEREGVKFGLIHIDGNHDEERVRGDLTLYLPRLERGGFVVMDDVSWDSVKAASKLIPPNLRKIYQRTDPLNDYSVLWDAPSWGAASLLGCRLAWLGKG